MRSDETERAARDYLAKLKEQCLEYARQFRIGWNGQYAGNDILSAFLAGHAHAQKWRHINEGWPEPEKMVLVYIPDAAEWQRIRTTFRILPKGKHNGLIPEWAGAALGVTHWLPLPPAPAAEGGK